MVNVQDGSAHSETGVTVIMNTTSETVEVDGRNEFPRVRCTLPKDVTTYVLCAPFLNMNICGLSKTFSESSCLSRKRTNKGLKTKAWSPRAGSVLESQVTGVGGGL